jgi:hypothetical protein
MIYEGQSVGLNRTVCLNCGKATSNFFPPSSAFIRYQCNDADCDMKEVMITIEKCSNIVFNVNPIYTIDGKPAWPKVELVDRDGKTVWPKACKAPDHV